MERDMELICSKCYFFSIFDKEFIVILYHIKAIKQFLTATHLIT